MQIQPILGYFGAIFGLYQPSAPPFWILASPFYISWIRPCDVNPYPFHKYGILEEGVYYLYPKYGRQVYIQSCFNAGYI